MPRFIYEKSVSYRGYLIIPFVLARFEQQSVYSYGLLSQLGDRGDHHRAMNPASLCSDRLEEVVHIAKGHLQRVSGYEGKFDYFKYRYTYHQHLFVIHGDGGRWYYDHYLPDRLNNVAAAKMFASHSHCTTWVKQEFDRHHYPTVDLSRNYE